MNSKELDDSLVLLFDPETHKPLGTGFFVTEDGDFVTTYHVLSHDLNNATRLGCQWNGHHLRVQLVGSLRAFYERLDCGTAQTDLVLLKARIPNKSIRPKPLPVTLSDTNASLPELLDVWGKGFRAEGRVHWKDAELRPFKAYLEAYHAENGTWSCASETPIFKGFSGSPVIIKGTDEAMGVIVRRLHKDGPVHVVQSLHILGAQLDTCEFDGSKLCLTRRILYNQYREIQSDLFEREVWPYAVDKKVFVNAFDYDTARFPLGKGTPITREEACVPFVVEQLSSRPVFCVGNYGMGKSTISKFLFTEYTSYAPDKCPVFIPLSGKRLPEPEGTGAHKFAVDQLCQIFREQRPARQTLSDSKDVVRGRLSSLVQDGQVVLILDGIDEAIIPSAASLTLFAKWLKSLDWTYFLTSRKEFHAFFDLVGSEMASRDHVVIQLKPWGSEQWNMYTASLSDKYPDREVEILQLKENLKSKEYGELPKRPLFLKMISDLVLNDGAYPSKVSEELKGNRAQIYSFYLKWKIRDDYERKQGKFQDLNQDDFEHQCFELFRRLATVEYTRSSPRHNITRLDRAPVDAAGVLGYSGFAKNDVAQACEGLWALEPAFVLKHLSGSPFFSLIQARIGNGEEKLYKFSHKSFCEYLFAYNLAETIFGGSKEDASCGPEWDLYQTFEVSAFFKDEQERRCSEASLSEEDTAHYLQVAFEKELLARAEFSTYSERLEEILYYTGRFAVRSPKIQELLKQIIASPIGVDATYYRTAHIALAFSESIDYCMKYVTYLIDSYRGDGEAFQLNSEIQADYYGKGDLHQALKKDIDRCLHGEDSDGIMPLRIFSYFTCLPFDPGDFVPARRYLAEIKGAFNGNEHSEMQHLLEETESIMKDIHRSEVA